MDITTLKEFTRLYPKFIQKYDDLSAPDSENVKDKINSIISNQNKIGNLTNDIVKQWNNVMAWVLSDGLTETLGTKIDGLIEDGSFNSFLQSMFDDINQAVTNFEGDVTNSLSLKRDKATLITMADIGQDVKSSMTGGSVAIVGGNSVGFDQLKSTLQNDVGVWNEKQPISPSAIGSVNITNNVVTGYGTQTYWYHESFTCVGGQRWRVSLSSAANPAVSGHIFAVDSNNNVVQSWYPGTNPATTLTDYEITIPTIAVNLIIQSGTQSTLKGKLLEYTNIATQTYVQGVLNPALDPIKDRINSYVGFTVGNVPKFTVTNATTYEVTVTLPTINKYFCWHKTAVDQINYDATTNTFIVPNNQTLAYDKVNKRLVVGDFTTLMLTVDNYIILAFNSYSKIAFGQWKQYYDSQVLSDSIATTASTIPTQVSTYKSYYDTNNYLGSKIDTINALQAGYINGDCLAWITDVHIADNGMTSFPVLKEVVKKTGANKIVFGGDLVTAYGSKSDLYSMSYKGMNALYDSYDYANIYSLRGNHDLTIRDNSTVTTGYTATKSEIYNMIVKRQRDYVKDNNNNLYFYFDNTKQKIRYICFDTCELTAEADYGTTKSWGIGYGVTQTQMDWVLNTALDIINQDGWTILFFGHIPILPAMTSYSNTLDCINAVIKSLKNKTVCSFTGNGITINNDFTASKADVIGYICGHNHRDESYVDNNVLHISSNCDARYQDSGITRTAGTITEGSFDVININKETRALNLTKIGAGTDRSFTY
jgi:hypothetical protein